MGLDIRWPIGLMFTLIGALLVIFGAASDKYQRYLGPRIVCIWHVHVIHGLARKQKIVAFEMHRLYSGKPRVV
jgi:hypothetical protein